MRLIIAAIVFVATLGLVFFSDTKKATAPNLVGKENQLVANLLSAESNQSLTPAKKTPPPKSQISNQPTVLNSISPSPVFTAIATATISPRLTPTVIFSYNSSAAIYTRTPSPTSIPNHTPTPSPTKLPAASLTPTPTLSPTPSPTPSASAIVSLTPTPTASPNENISVVNTPSPTPSPSDSSSPSPSLSSTPTSSPSPTPSPTPINDIVVIYLTNPVKRGNDAELKISVSTTASCVLKVTLPSGSVSTSKGLNTPTAADLNGVIDWQWRVGSATKPGNAVLDISCNVNNQNLSKSLQMTISE